MNKNRSKKNFLGFTLIEIIISTAIIALLTSVFLADYHSANKRSELNLFMQEMASNIRLMQSYGLGTYKYEGAVSEGGWGFYIDKTNKNYILFADINNDQKYTDSSELFKTVNFPNDVKINDIITSSSIASINVTFVPPVPKVNIGDVNDYDDVTITLEDGQGNTKGIYINYFGLIDVERN